MSHFIVNDLITFDAIDPHYDDYKNGEPACTIRGFTDEELTKLKKSSLKIIRIYHVDNQDVAFMREITNIKIADMYKLDDGRTPVVISWKHPSEHNVILQKAITHYGEPAQVLKAIEESLELAIELTEHITSFCFEDMECLIVAKEHSKDALSEIKSIFNSDNLTYIKSKDDVSNITTEIADVHIMLQQLEMFLVKPEEVQEQIDFKVKRLEQRINEDV